MHIRRGSTLLAGSIAAVTALLALTLPAAATTVDIAVVGGSLTIHRPNTTPIQTVDLAVPRVECPPSPANAMTTTTGTTITVTVGARFATVIVGTPFIVQRTTTLTGTYTGGPPTHGISGTTSSTTTAIRSTGTGSCTPLGGAGSCTITASNITWNGTLDAADIHDLIATDTATISGSNPAFNLVVTGTAANCGVLSAVNSGYVTFTGVTLHVL